MLANKQLRWDPCWQQKKNVDHLEFKTRVPGGLARRGGGGGEMDEVLVVSSVLPLSATMVTSQGGTESPERAMLGAAPLAALDGRWCPSKPPFYGSWMVSCILPVSPKAPWWWVQSGGAVGTMSGHLVSSPSISNNSANGGMKGQRGEGLVLDPFKTQIRGPPALGISPGRSISLPLGPALLLHPPGVGLWLLGGSKICPLTFCPCDLSKTQIGPCGPHSSSSSSFSVPLEKPTALTSHLRSFEIWPLTSALCHPPASLGWRRRLLSPGLCTCCSCSSYALPLMFSRAPSVASSDPSGADTPSSELPELSVIPVSTYVMGLELFVYVNLLPWVGSTSCTSVWPPPPTVPSSVPDTRLRFSEGL